MKLQKLYERVKKYLSIIEDEKEIEKRKIRKIIDKIEDKISKIKQKIKSTDDIQEENKLEEEMTILKKFKKQLKNKK